jgi:NitT/TauT family transport system substrate-binding protein
METGHMVMKGYLREHGLAPDVDVQYIYLDSQASIAEAVQKGEVDLGFVNSGYGYVAEGNGLKVAFHAGDFVEGFPCCRQSTSGKALAEKKDALIKFEIAALRAYEIYENDHAKTIEVLSAYSGQDAAYTEAVMYGTDAYRNAMIVSLNPNRKKVLDFYETMKLNGDIDANTPVDMADHIDTTVYETALQTLAEREADNTLWQELILEAKETNDD